jgi:signal transduction histidine kinase
MNRCGILLLLFLTAQLAAAQPASRAIIDSLHRVVSEHPEEKQRIHALTNLAYVYRPIDPDSGLMFGQRALEMSIAKKNDWGIAKSHKMIGINHGAKTDHVKALEHLMISLTAFEKLDSTESNVNSIASVHLDIGTVHAVTKNYPLAIEHYETAARLYDAIGLKSMSASCHNNMANIHREHRRFDEALNWYNKALATFQELNDAHGIAVLTGNIGTVYGDMEEHERSMPYYRKALDHFNSTPDSNNIARFNQNLGTAYAGLLKDSLRTARHDSLADRRLLAERAAFHLNKSLGIYDRLGNRLFVSEILNALSQVKEAQGNSDEALTLYRRSVAYRDSVLSKENHERIEALIAQRESDVRKKEIQLQQLRLAKAEQQRWYLIGVIILIIALAAVLFNRFRLQQRNRRILEMERIRSRISRDLHDDIGSTLSSINMLTHAAKKRLGENELDNTSETLDKIQERTSRMLDNMSDIVWNIKPENDALGEILGRMREYASTTLEAKGIDFTIGFPGNEVAMELPLEVKNNMYTVFKEAINNLAKHAGATKAEITLSIEKDRLLLVVKDNGTGFDVERNGSGNGLHNMIRRSEDVGAMLKVDPRPGMGTTITFAVGITRTRDAGELVRT